MRYSFGKSRCCLGIFAIAALGFLHVMAQQSQPSADRPQPYYDHDVQPSLSDELVGTSAFQPAESDALARTGSHVIPEDAHSVKRQVVVETCLLTCDETDLEKLFDHVDRWRFTLTGRNDLLVGGVWWGPNGKESGTFSIGISNAPATAGKISNQQLDSIIRWTKGTETCDIMQAPALTLFDGATDASLRPFVVGFRLAERDAFRGLQVSCRSINEDIKLKIGVSIGGDETDLALALVYNKTELIYSQASLLANEWLLIDTGMNHQSQRIVESAASKSPLSGRPDSRKMKIVPQRLLVMLRATPIPMRSTNPKHW